MELYTDADAFNGGASASASAMIDYNYYEVVGGTGSAYLAIDFTRFYTRTIFYGSVGWYLDIDGTDYSSQASPIEFGCYSGDPNCVTQYTNTIDIPVVFGQDYTIELWASVSSGALSIPEAFGIFADDYSSPGFGGGPSTSPFSIVDSNGNIVGSLALTPEPATCLAVVPALLLFLLLGSKRSRFVGSRETVRRQTSV